MNEVSQTGIGTCILDSTIMCKNFFHFMFLFLDVLAVKKHHHDFDRDSGIGSSTFTDRNSTTLSEVSCYFHLITFSVVAGHGGLSCISYLTLFY